MDSFTTVYTKALFRGPRGSCIAGVRRKADSYSEALQTCVSVEAIDRTQAILVRLAAHLWISQQKLHSMNSRRICMSLTGSLSFTLT